MIRILLMTLGLAVTLGTCAAQNVSPGMDLKPKARKAFEAYSSLGEKGDFKAFYFSPSKDVTGSSLGFATVDKAIYVAGKFCAKQAPDCKLYAIGDTVVRDKDASAIQAVKEKYEKRLHIAGDKDLGKHLTGTEIGRQVPNHMLEGHLFGGLDVVAGLSGGGDAEILFPDIPNHYSRRDMGHWSIEDDKICLKMKRFFDSDETCFEINKRGDIYQLVTENAEIYATFRMTRPYDRKTGLFSRRKENSKQSVSREDKKKLKNYIYNIGVYVAYSELCSQFRGNGADNLTIRDVKEEFAGHAEFKRGYDKYASYSSYDFLGGLTNCDKVRDWLENHHASKFGTK